MCFEFEALYWAKVAEEEMKKKEAEKSGQKTIPADDGRDRKPQPHEEPLAV
ncbi:MAG TPA: hypothetical protein VMP00_08315 [Burkholderiales bacterium]|nr:hypothetical protein [Burkholderiales bacterium]